MAKLFAGMLLQLRQESGVSQRDAAAALGISQSLLSHYEKGSREPRLDFLIRAASYYHVTTDFLLGCSPERARSDRQPDVLSEKNRVLVETMRFILTHLEADDDPVFSEAAVRYISLALYKICRYLCLAVPATAEHFAADAQCFSEYADAAMKREEITMKRWSLRRGMSAPSLSNLWNSDLSEPMYHAAVNMLHRCEGLMRDCIPLA